MASIATRLTGLATTGDNVYRARQWVQEQTRLPSLNILQSEDAAIDESDGQVAYPYVDRRLVVQIQARAMGTTQLETDLNSIEAEVFVAMAADHLLGVAGVLNSFYLTTLEPELDEGDQRLAMLAMAWAVEYRHQMTDPSLPP